MIIISKYSVVKNFGHFTQSYRIEAKSKEDAWNRAERDGKLIYQTAYREPTDLTSKGYVSSLDENENQPISEEQYYEWMREAIDKGMMVTPDEYEKALGLPFHDVW